MAFVREGGGGDDAVKRGPKLDLIKKNLGKGGGGNSVSSLESELDKEAKSDNF